jgi:hypothetical protein
VTADGAPHASDPEGLARALADLLGRPALASVLARALEDPDAAARLWADVAWEPG